ncbi:target of SBF [Elasticomyces elasticus]|nr:target of SBF [Elasticomyces elasticus]
MDQSPVKKEAAVQSPNAISPHEALRRPSLLPAFELFSSSPAGLPRKRKFEDRDENRTYYPTPVPTSSTGMLPSTPPSRSTRPPQLQRTVSSLSERAPLGAVPSLDLPANGEPVLMGRSSNSSDYQLSSNRLISRVHVKATYHAPSSSHPLGEVIIECKGWNGCRVHARGQIVELKKGETFHSDKPSMTVMVDVQDTRVMLAWPQQQDVVALSASRSPFEEETPRPESTALERFGSSPPPLFPRNRSPESPTPYHRPIVNEHTTFLAGEVIDEGDVQVYEDENPDESFLRDATPVPSPLTPAARTGLASSRMHLTTSQSSALSDGEELSEHDEENDPIVHSFGPFGDDILSKFESFKSGSPDRPRKPLRRSLGSPIRREACADTENTHPNASPVKNMTKANASPVKDLHSPIRNHVINQLAYSRLHSLPLSTIHNNLPAELKSAAKTPQNGVTTLELKAILDGIPCVGEILREGKDAAGKALENEYYYAAEMDADEMRKTAVAGGKTGLRAVRKQHKQYFWKKPRV